MAAFINFTDGKYVSWHVGKEIILHNNRINQITYVQLNGHELEAANPKQYPFYKNEQVFTLQGEYAKKYVREMQKRYRKVKINENNEIYFGTWWGSVPYWAENLKSQTVPYSEEYFLNLCKRTMEEGWSFVVMPREDKISFAFVGPNGEKPSQR